VQPTLRHNSTPGATLSPVQAQVAEAIASGLSLSAAARKCDVHRATVHNWLNDLPDFRAQIDTSRQFFQESLRDELKDLSSLALAKLRQLLENPETPPSVALRAALAVLNRPQLPAGSWSLPEDVHTPAQQQQHDALAMLKADMLAFDKHQKFIAELLKAPEQLVAQVVPKPPAPEPKPKPVDFDKPCPCGIGFPYKLHCGRKEWLKQRAANQKAG
jgi:transposase-like protein